MLLKIVIYILLREIITAIAEIWFLQMNMYVFHIKIQIK